MSNRHMTDEEIRDRYLLQHSVERVINTTLKILEQSRHPDSAMNLEDWIEAKEHVVHIFNEARNQAYKRLNNQKEGK